MAAAAAACRWLKHTWERRRLATTTGSAGVSPETTGNAGVSPAQNLSSKAHASQHKQWHSRGYLPHCDQPGLLQSITFRLHDALPHEVVKAWKKELDWQDDLPANDPRAVELHRRIARYEDAGHGHCWLAQEGIARCVEDALLYFDSQRYRLLAWCVMPNHVHVLVETFAGYPLGKIVHAWKSFTAKQANQRLGRSGTFWMPDYHDRYIRDDNHLIAVITYIENNPVKAGLVKSAAEWAWSSASRRGDAGERSDT